MKMIESVIARSEGATESRREVGWGIHVSFMDVDIDTAIP